MMMVATHIKKIKHSMLFVIGVCLRDITNTIFVIVSHLSVFLFFFFCFFVLRAGKILLFC